MFLAGAGAALFASNISFLALLLVLLLVLLVVLLVVPVLMPVPVAVGVFVARAFLIIVYWLKQSVLDLHHTVCTSYRMYIETVVHSFYSPRTTH